MELPYIIYYALAGGLNTTVCSIMSDRFARLCSFRSKMVIQNLFAELNYKFKGLFYKHEECQLDSDYCIIQL